MYGSVILQDPVNRACKLNRGLRARWLCLPSQNRGVRWPDLCRKLDGSLSSSMSPTTDWRTAKGRPGGYGALNFEGTSNYKVDLTSPPALTTWSISFWARQDTTATYKAVYGANNNALYLKSGVLLYFNGADRSATTALTVGTWGHFTCTCDASSGLTFYFNGKPDGTNAATPTLAATATIGYPNGAVTNGFDGLLDDIWLHDRVLTPMEVRALYVDSRLGSLQSLNWHEDDFGMVPAAPPSGGNILGLMLHHHAAAA